MAARSARSWPGGAGTKRRPGTPRRTPWHTHPTADYLRGVVRIVREIARTLHHVHLARVAHRDIKPANILLDRHREDGIFLCDFGLARDLDVATPEQLRDGAGTPLYMPPERLLRLPCNENLCDLYSLGATLYEAVTLVPPVQIPESLPWPAWTSYLASTTPARPRSVRPELNTELESVILHAMEHEPDQRHTTAARARRGPRMVPEQQPGRSPSDRIGPMPVPGNGDGGDRGRDEPAAVAVLAPLYQPGREERADKPVELPGDRRDGRGRPVDRGGRSRVVSHSGLENADGRPLTGPAAAHVEGFGDHVHATSGNTI